MMGRKTKGIREIPSKGGWYATIGGKRVRLGPTERVAKRQYDRIRFTNAVQKAVQEFPTEHESLIKLLAALDVPITEEKLSRLGMAYEGVTEKTHVDTFLSDVVVFFGCGVPPQPQKTRTKKTAEVHPEVTPEPVAEPEPWRAVLDQPDPDVEFKSLDELLDHEEGRRVKQIHDEDNPDPYQDHPRTPAKKKKKKRHSN